MRGWTGVHLILTERLTDLAGAERDDRVAKSWR
jgi:hypothetical protein